MGAQSNHWGIAIPKCTGRMFAGPRGKGVLPAEAEGCLPGALPWLHPSMTLTSALPESPPFPAPLAHFEKYAL